jgi:hypothetical protein
MINELPTIFEVVTGAAKKQSKEKSTVTNNSSSKNKSGIKVGNLLITGLPSLKQNINKTHNGKFVSRLSRINCSI